MLPAWRSGLQVIVRSSPFNTYFLSTSLGLAALQLAKLSQESLCALRFRLRDSTRGESRGLVDHSGLDVRRVGTHVPAVGADRVTGHTQVDRLVCVQRTDRGQWPG